MIRLYKNKEEVNYEEIDRKLCILFSIEPNEDYFANLPNKSKNSYLTNIDWLSMLNQGIEEEQPKTYDTIIEFYKKDYGLNKKELKTVVPQLFTLIAFLKQEKITITQC